MTPERLKELLLKKKQEFKATHIEPNPPPRYDEIYFQGLEYLNNCDIGKTMEARGNTDVPSMYDDAWKSVDILKQMSFVNRESLPLINTVTKYPSIPTYHALGEKGRLTESLQATFDDDEVIFVTEKIDGTNARIILTNDVYLIGSREELLYAKGDLVGNPALGIVSALSECAESLLNYHLPNMYYNFVIVYYFEVFGGKVSANSKQYTGEQKVSFRCFDVADINLNPLTSMPIEKLAGWRETKDSYQKFRKSVTPHTDIVPYISTILGKDMPKTVRDTSDWLRNIIPTTNVLLDEKGGKRPEGVVIRNKDRSKIAKIRFEDYQRTLGKGYF